MGQTDPAGTTAFSMLFRLAHRLLSDHGDHADTMAAVTEMLASDLGDGCAVLLTQRDGDLDPVAVTHRSPQGRQILSDLLVGGPSPDEWLAALPISTRQVLHLPMVPRGLVEVREQEATLPSDAINSLVVAPIWDADKVIGTLWMSRDGNEAFFSDDEVRLLESAGRLIGAAIARAHRLGDLRERLAASETEFEELDRRLGRTTATAEQLSHLVTQRLRGPVAALVGLVDLLASHDLDEPTRFAVTTRLRERADEASRLLWNLIESSRSTAPSGEEPESSDLGDVADWVARLLAPRLQVIGGEMEVRAAGILPIPPRMTRDLLLAMTDAVLRQATAGAHIQLLGDVSEGGWRLAIMHKDREPVPDPTTGEAWRECRRLIADLDVTFDARPVSAGGWVVVVEPASA